MLAATHFRRSRHLTRVASENSALTLRRSADAPEQFADFYREHFDAILAFLMRRVGDAELALDLAAESFAQAYVARRRFRGSTPQQAQAWIYQIAKRQLSRYLSRGRLERRAIQKLGIAVPQLDDEQQARIEELADLDGLRTILRSELARLSPAQQAALQLRIVDELPYVAVAQHLEITEQAARLRVSRGLAALATALEDNPRIRERTA